MTGVERLVAIHAGADGAARLAGREWYPCQWRRCRRVARATGVTPHRAAAVFAALSPRVHVARAWDLTERACEYGGLAVGHFEHTLRKVGLVLVGNPPLGVLTGPKTRAFYRNICGDTDAVTVDVWAARAVGLAPPGTPRQYDAMAAAYRSAAAVVGETPRDLQAIVWCATRGAAD